MFSLTFWLSVLWGTSAIKILISTVAARDVHQIKANSWFYVHLPQVPFFFLLPWSLQLSFVPCFLSSVGSKIISNIWTGEDHLISAPPPNSIIVSWFPGHLKKPVFLSTPSLIFQKSHLLFSCYHFCLRDMYIKCHKWEFINCNEQEVLWYLLLSVSTFKKKILEKHHFQPNKVNLHHL